MYTPSQCQARRAKNCRLNKRMPQEYLDATPEELSKICNGVGTDKFGPIVLFLTSGMFNFYTDDADIHDFIWTKLNDGTVETWQKSNEDFRHNTQISAANTTLFFGWFRREAKAQLRNLGSALASVVESDIGWKVWRS